MSKRTQFVLRRLMEFIDGPSGRLEKPPVENAKRRVTDHFAQ
jgi:hypothetical protein